MAAIPQRAAARPFSVWSASCSEYIAIPKATTSRIVSRFSHEVRARISAMTKQCAADPPGEPRCPPVRHGDAVGRAQPAVSIGAARSRELKKAGGGIAEPRFQRNRRRRETDGTRQEIEPGRLFARKILRRADQGELLGDPNRGPQLLDGDGGMSLLRFRSQVRKGKVQRAPPSLAAGN